MRERNFHGSAGSDAKRWAGLSCAIASISSIKRAAMPSKSRPSFDFFFFALPSKVEAVAVEEAEGDAQCYRLLLRNAASQAEGPNSGSESKANILLNSIALLSRG